MNISRRYLGAAAAGAVAVVACAVSRSAEAEKNQVGALAASGKHPDAHDIGVEISYMCDYCYAQSDAGTGGADRCSKTYPEVYLMMSATGCSYPPCPTNLIRLSDGGTDYGDPEAKLACAACRAMCPFSAGKPTKAGRAGD